MEKKGLLIILSGPSGVGKGTVRLELMKDKSLNLFYSISMTTRPRREGEVDGREYYFVTREEFEGKLQRDEIVEHTCYCGNYYGTLRSEVERHMREKTPVILVIEVEGAGNIKRMYPGATTIFVLPPNMEELERRLRYRGTEDEETIQKRLKRAQTEIANSVDYDEHVVNVEVDSCAESLYSIIQFHIAHGKE